MSHLGALILSVPYDLIRTPPPQCSKGNKRAIYSQKASCKLLDGRKASPWGSISLIWPNHVQTGVRFQKAGHPLLTYWIAYFQFYTHLLKVKHCTINKRVEIQEQLMEMSCIQMASYGTSLLHPQYHMNH